MMSERIPKRIIQTGKSADLSLRERAAARSLQLLNPDFEYLFFDDHQVVAFIDQHFPHYRRLFDTFPFHIQKYDFFRYLAVYYYGGFYFDLDVFLASNLSHLLRYSSVFPFEGLTFSSYLRDKCHIDWQIGNYAFGASPHHPFLHAIIDNCAKAQSDEAWVRTMMKGTPLLSRSEFLVLNTTGPGLISRTLAENPELGVQVAVLFAEDVCDVRTWNRFGDLGIHMMDGTWRTGTGYLRRRLAQRWESWQMERLIRESRRLGKTRLHPGNLV